MSGQMLLVICAFGFVSSLVFLVMFLLTTRQRSVDQKQAADLFDIETTDPAGARASPLLRKLGTSLMPDDATKRQQLKQRILQAGFYRRHTTAVYLGSKFVLMVAPIAIGFALASVGFATVDQAILYGAIVGLAGNVGPSLWLDYFKKGRQQSIRRALPDALDVTIICMEGGLSLTGAFARVADELHAAYPLLASEMAIVRREMQLGRTTADALTQFADRFDIEELRSLASVIGQAERYGASLVSALRVHADSLRVRRHQEAEARAQKAPLKLIFPTVLFIFPALYIALMGPAGIILFEAFGSF